MNVFELQAKISLDTKGYEKGLGEAKSKFSIFADGLKGAVGKASDVLAGIGKAAAVGVGTAGTLLTVLTKQALDAVGSFEQLEGGAQKIFDEMNFDKISRDAKNAYKELNMSAMEYLEAINLAGATFAQTMGDEKGYDTARKGMLSIADYASGTGRNLTELNQKYQMITRATSSYQSIADQFSGILPATSAAFLEQAKAAGFLSETYEKLTEVPVAEYQQALTDMLEYGVNKLGLSNNTLRESTETLTGSFAMAKAAWKNFLTGQGTTQDFVGAFTSAIGNTRGKLNEIIPRLTDGLNELVDLLAPEIPSIIEGTLPSIISGSSVLISGLANRLPQLLTAILPSLADGVVDVTTALVGVMPELITSLKQSIPIVVQTIMSKKGDLLQTGKDIISAIFPPNMDLGAIVDEGTNVVNNLMNGLLSDNSINLMLEKAPIVLKNIGNAIKTVLLGSDQDGTSGILGAANSIIDRLTDYFDKQENRQKFYEAAKQMLINLGNFLVDNVEVIIPFIAKLAGALAAAIVNMLNDAIVSLFNSDYKLGAVGQYSNAMQEAYQSANTDLTFDKWIESGMPGLPETNDYNPPKKQSTYYISEGMLAANGWDNALAKEAYQKHKGYATGFYATQPTWLNHTLIGERGDEVLLPLDTNTAWMDKLADKLGSKMNGGIYITVNAPTGNADDIVNALDEAFRNRQIAQDRSTGGTGWK